MVNFAIIKIRQILIQKLRIENVYNTKWCLNYKVTYINSSIAINEILSAFILINCEML